MAVISEYSLPKGNSGMTLYGSSNDDSTVSLPAMPFAVKYNNASFTVLYTSGNTWIGFGSGSEHLKINRRDASYNKLYYANETEYGFNVFRIRFEGNSYYSSWNSNDLIWEFTVFEDGVFRLVIEKSPNNAADSFVNPSIGNQSFTFTTGKSYIFTPQNEAASTYLVEEGSYIPCINKYLMTDSVGVKGYKTIDGVSSWMLIGDLPVTLEMFTEHGVESLPASMEGLENTATLYFYTDNPNTVATRESYEIEVKQVVTSKPQIIKQVMDFNLLPGRTINRIVAVVCLVRKSSTGTDIPTDGKIRIAISFNGGISFYTFNNVTMLYESIDINNTAEFLSLGISLSDLVVLDYSELNTLITSARTIRFAYILEKPTLTDVCKLKTIKIFYN